MDEVQTQTYLSTNFVGLITNAAPFDDVRVRQAFAMAIDKQQLVKTRQSGASAAGLLPPEMPGFNPDLKPLSFDPEGARQLLEASGYGGGKPTITLAFSEPSRLTCESVANMWRQNLGVDVLFLVTSVSSPALPGSYQAFYDGWRADYPAPENFLEPLFHSQSSTEPNLIFQSER